MEILNKRKEMLEEMCVKSVSKEKTLPVKSFEQLIVAKKENWIFSNF